MSHVASHIIIRGGDYGDYPPAEGQTRAEVHYVPSKTLTEDQVNQNISRLRKLIDKIYHIEETVD